MQLALWRVNESISVCFVTLLLTSYAVAIGHSQAVQPLTDALTQQIISFTTET